MFFVVVFTLLSKEDLEKAEAAGKDKGSTEHAERKAQPVGEEEFQPDDDDVD